jgi:hypothetical protein
MSKFYKHKKYSNYKKPLTKIESFQLVLVAVIFTVCFVFYIIKGFIFNCIFEWPIRWDIMTCWTEQINPTVQKASEAVVNFLP